MSNLHPHRSLTGLCLLAAVATPVLFFGTQIAAAPFYSGFRFSLLSVSMLGSHFSRHPWIFNTGEMLTGCAALGGASGFYRFLRAKTQLLLGCVVAIPVAATGVMCLKAGMFPLPDARHNSWGLLFNFQILIPFQMLIGLWTQSRSAGFRAYLIFSVALLLVLIPLVPRLGPGDLQDLIAAGTLVPVGVVGFHFWRELQRSSPGQTDSRVSSGKSRSSSKTNAPIENC